MDTGLNDSAIIFVLIFIGAGVLVALAIGFFFKREYWLSGVEKALREKNYKEAIDQALKYLKHRPSNFLVHKYMGEAYEGLAHYRHSIESYEKALVELEKENVPALRVEILLKLGNLYRSADRNGEALGYYKMVLEHSQKNSVALWNIAEILFEAKKYGPCKDYLERFAEVKPDNNKVPLLLSKVYYYIGEFQKSIEQIGKITEASQYYSIVQINEFMLLLAYNFFALKKYGDVINTLKPLLNEEIISGEVLTKVVTSMIKTGQNEKAMDTIDNCLMRLSPNDRCKVLYDIAKVFFAGNDIINALALWRSAYEINPRFLDLAVIMEKYDVLFKNQHLDSYYNSNNYEVFKEYILKKLHIISEKSILEMNGVFMIVKENFICSILYRLASQITPDEMDEVENMIKNFGFANLSIDIYTLFGIEENAKKSLFYKKIKEISGQDFLNVFTADEEPAEVLMK